MKQVAWGKGAESGRGGKGEKGRRKRRGRGEGSDVGLWALPLFKSVYIKYTRTLIKAMLQKCYYQSYFPYFLTFPQLSETCGRRSVSAYGSNGAKCEDLKFCSICTLHTHTLSPFGCQPWSVQCCTSLLHRLDISQRIYGAKKKRRKPKKKLGGKE